MQLIRGLANLTACRLGTLIESEMNLAIMQPYLFPYLGYFQLIHAVDTFVVYDDVNFIKGGWINRNFILSQGEKARITLELRGASPNRLINEVGIVRNRTKLLRTLRESYSRAPCFPEVYPLIEEILTFENSNLAHFLDHSLRRLCGYLGLAPTWRLSSDIEKDSSLRGQDKVLALCSALGAEHYVNLPGGERLYDPGVFENAGIRLSFIHPGDVIYDQRVAGFVPNLSIIDVAMFNSGDECRHLLTDYTLA